jgi:outer membrane protein assembly factor BamB
MTDAKVAEPSARPLLRLWPGVVGVALILLAALVGAVATEVLPFAMMAAVVAGLLIVAWWVLFSRAPWPDRLGAVVLMVAAVAAARRLLDPSIAGAGMGWLYYFLVIPGLGLALVAGAVLGRRLAATPRRVAMAALILVACGAFALIRTGGTSGSSPVDVHWRWTPTPEQLLLAREPVALPPLPLAAETPLPPPASREAPPASAAVATARPPEAQRTARAGSEPEAAAAAPEPAPDEAPAPWPGFRGPQRDSVVRGSRLSTDWAASPPVALWRRAIGPGWSSFAVGAELLYTQEQRGDDEIVACYRVGTGEPVWRHLDPARFWESNGGAGPRGTPTLSGSRVYSFGATGLVNALDARSGSVVWSRDAAEDAGRKVPYWGFSSSPLVVGDLVIVAASGTLVAYDAATGERRWLGPSRGGSYSSAHFATVDGVPQVLLLRGEGVTSVAPSDGAVLWEHTWEGGAIVQPALTPEGHVLIAANDMSGGIGLRRLALARGEDAWSVAERWTTRGLKPYFSDYVVHHGHAYGFDGNILSCIDLADGKRRWKGGRYGSGQMLLLADQALLLVLSEDGELALVKASPDQFTEVARVPGVDGKTWNHPALVGNVLLVRNGQEMAAFRLARAAE